MKILMPFCHRSCFANNYKILRHLRYYSKKNEQDLDPNLKTKKEVYRVIDKKRGMDYNIYPSFNPAYLEGFNKVIYISHPQAPMEEPEINMTYYEMAKSEAKEFPSNVKKTLNYYREGMFSPIVIRESGDMWKLHEFKNEDDIDDWLVSVDSDYGVGYSSAKMELTDHNTALFHGYIDTTVPKDGITKYSGFANVTGPTELRPLRGTAIPLNLDSATHFAMRIRGDGRVYKFIFDTSTEIDMTFHDRMQGLVHTRGGPHWQIVLLPISRLINTAFGRIQDDQPFEVKRGLAGKNVGFTVSGVKGHFKLEIDYVGLFKDNTHTEKTRYEQNAYFDLPIEH